MAVGRRKRHATAAEVELFRTAMRDVTPLRRESDSAEGQGGATAVPVPLARDRRASPQAVRPDLAQLDQYRPELAPAEKLLRQQALQPSAPRKTLQPARGDHPTLPGRQAQVDGLDGRTWRRLKRGRLPIEARIDLHGMTQAEAHSALQGFVLQAQARGDRTVLVITGKGTPRKRDDRPRRGAIRSAMPHWLQQPPLNRIVITYTEAQPQDGGSGAFYLRLRRLRVR